MADDDAWMDGGLADDGEGERVPVRLATKAELSAATGLSVVQLDRLVRDGAPVARRGASRKEGLRFNLPDFIAWYVERVASRRAAAGDGYVSAKERAAVALATLREYEIAKKQNELIPVDDVIGFIERWGAQVKKGVLELSSEISLLSVAQRIELGEAARRLLLELSGSKDEYGGKIQTPEEHAPIDRLYDMDAPQEADESVNGSAEVA
jgi:hypothetical protein